MQNVENSNIILTMEKVGYEEKNMNIALFNENALQISTVIVIYTAITTILQNKILSYVLNISKINRADVRRKILESAADEFRNV